MTLRKHRKSRKRKSLGKSRRRKSGKSRRRKSRRKSRRSRRRSRSRSRKTRRKRRKRGGVANEQLKQVNKCRANKKPDGTYKTGLFGMNKAARAKCDELLCGLDGKTWDQGQCHNF